MKNNINLSKIGSFYIGGHKITISGKDKYVTFINNGKQREIDPNGDFWTGQMYVQYYLQAEAKSKYPLMLWHGGGLSGACWEDTPDGQEGFVSYFLRQGFDVYVSDAVERGRASWSQYPDIYTSEPIFRTYQQAWESFRIGPKYVSDPKERMPFVNSQYPVEYFDVLMMQAIPRWTTNSESTIAAYKEYLQKIGSSIIVVHSQGCIFAEQAAIDNPENIKAIVYLEPAGIPMRTDEQLRQLKDIPQLFVWGDNLDAYPTWSKNSIGQKSYYQDARSYYEKLKRYSDKVEWLELPELGIKGNSHMLIQEKNNLEIADLIYRWLAKYIKE